MKWNYNENGEGGGKRFPTFVKGKRYNLVVSGAEDRRSKEKLTPYLHIIIETEALEPAHDKKLWNTPAAAYRAVEWMKAFGFRGDGEEDVPAENLKGIRFSAEASFVKGGDDKDYLEWINPLPIKVGEPQAHPAAAMAPASTKPEAKEDPEDVPF